MSMSSRWITVSNRLPFTVSKDSRKITTASGGLVSALGGVKSLGERIWIGCAPENLREDNWPRIRQTLKERARETSAGDWDFEPVFVEPKLYDLYYDGFCNDVLWPLLHYETNLVDFKDEAWCAYREMNLEIAKKVLAVAKLGDVVWIHDYHLFLLPKILKKARPDLKIGFFLHVPFPSFEVFRQIPVREEILDSLLDADLVGFHDYSYLRHFCSSLLRILGVESTFLTARRGEKVTRLGVFPVSIDTDDFMQKAKDEKIEALTKSLAKPTFTFLGVDRLDYIKGLDLKLKAFQLFLRKFPQFHGKVSLLQVAVPTREGVPVYNRLADEVARLIGEINGDFSSPTWTPIHYIHSSITNDQLIALYKSCDALLVTSKRDGMNLVALEYIAAQTQERPGVVLLSEFAGASSTLSHAININPWDLGDTANKMQIAMEMPKHEKNIRLQTMQKHLQQYTATDWAMSFITDLERSSFEKPVGPVAFELDQVSELARDIRERHPSKILVFIDYDGTLVAIQPTPEQALLSQHQKVELERLTRIAGVELCIISGRDSQFLESQFKGLNVRLVAEHGAKTQAAGSTEWSKRSHCSTGDWYSTALKIISDYASRVPHSRVEQKEFSIAWHYRQSPSEFGEFQAKKLAEELEIGLSSLPVTILRGKKVIEARAMEADKGVFAAAYLATQPDNTFVLALGDDRTDEDLFRAMSEGGYSFKIGKLTPDFVSRATYQLADPSDVLPFLTRLLTQLEPQLDPPLEILAETRSTFPSP